jgi:hypothetical protein
MAEGGEDQISALVLWPAESINVELKTWIDPRTPEGVNKFVRGIFALQNHNGGFMLIGFDDVTAAPDPYSLTGAVDEIFHAGQDTGHRLALCEPALSHRDEFPGTGWAAPSRDIDSSGRSRARRGEVRLVVAQWQKRFVQRRFVLPHIARKQYCKQCPDNHG